MKPLTITPAQCEKWIDAPVRCFRCRGNQLPLRTP